MKAMIVMLTKLATLTEMMLVPFMAAGNLRCSDVDDADCMCLRSLARIVPASQVACVIVYGGGVDVWRQTDPISHSFSELVSDGSIHNQ